jgi:UDP-2,4-diacetamido-2,4,6-trideoxy-beta-L-altropyranose hydrolase
MAARRIQVAIRVDASSAIGLGHAMRCLSLVDALRRARHAVTVLSAEMPQAILDRYLALGASVTMLSEPPGSSQDALATRRFLCQGAVDWLIIDGYRFGTAWQSAVRVPRVQLLMLDDEAIQPAWNVDVILNPNLGADVSVYAERAPGAQYLCGAPYALVRREFLARRAWTRRIEGPAQRLLITLGGADPDNITATMVEAVRDIAGLDVRVIIGAANPHRDALTRLLEQGAPHQGTWELLVQVDDMPAQMRWADLAVSAGGTTLWELAMLQLPALVVQLAENQRPGLTAYTATGAARSLGTAETLDVRLVAGQVHALCADVSARRSMARAAARLVDGGGSERVVRFMEGGT